MSAVTPPVTTPLFEVRDLKVHFPIHRSGGRVVRAIDGVDLEWHRGEMLGIVGESGCGKSTLGRALLGLQPPTSGEILVDGTAARERRPAGRPPPRADDLPGPVPVAEPAPDGRRPGHGAARDPRHRAAATERLARAVATLESAGLAPAARYWDRYPHELSGGQRQRVVIAAAMALEPEALICDEPVSALDVSVRAQVLHVLMGLKRDHDLGLIFITHDLGLAWALCDRIAVMYLGRIVESGPAEQVIGDPRHPYTQSLLSVVPSPYPREVRRQILAGELPDAANIPSGCRFHPRCPKAFDRCPTGRSRASSIGVGADGHGTACWLVDG